MEWSITRKFKDKVLVEVGVTFKEDPHPLGPRQKVSLTPTEAEKLADELREECRPYGQRR